MIAHRIQPYALAALLLGGCATPGGDAPPPPVPPASTPPASATAQPHLGTLAPRKLAAGECGMFLWARTAERNLVFFNTRTGAGRAVLGGREVELARASVSGAEILGQFETQTFAYEGLVVEVQVQFERRPGLARGAIIPQGALRMRRDDGWEYVLPVGGLVGCEGA